MEDMPILYEDDDIVVIAKPANVVVHHDAQHTSGTVVDWALAQYPSMKNVGENSGRPGIVHRLDKDTTGALILCKNQKAFLHFKKLFQTGKVTKKYRALVVGIPKDDAGIINAPIARSTKNFQKRVVGGGQGRSREAVTEYSVIERFPESNYALIEAIPKTGRTHQIRSHLAHIGFPVACDHLYGGKRYGCPIEPARQMLHAHSLDFPLPSGKSLHIEAPLPDDFDRALQELHKRG